jgi:tetratricopeptide (TPR) repeat protein
MKYSHSAPLLLLFVFLALPGWSTTIDSLVRWNEINFSSTFERTVLTSSLKKSEKDYLKLFLANSLTGEAEMKLFEQKINETIREIESSGALKKKNDKKVKQIYNMVHDRFLIKYQLENRFYEIIKTGDYNCVTATALYAIIFEKLSIPYTIKEEPTHVYLVAYPNTENILVETTTPFSGLLAFDASFKANYVNTLRNQKIIGGTESLGSVDELFNKYYFGKENITLSQLVGIHYMNDGLFKRDHDDLAGAYEQLKKAYLYYPNTRSQYLLMVFTAAQLENSDLDPLKRAALIGQISRFKSGGITTEMVKGEFHLISQTVLSKNNDKEMYRKCYEETLKYITDPEVANEISYIYNYESGRVFYNQGNYTRAKPFFSNALSLQPNNVDLGGVFVGCLAQTFRNERNNSAIVDSLEFYKRKFKSLEQNNNFNSIMALAYIIECGNSYQKGNATKGEKYRLLFEGMYDSAMDITILSPHDVGNAYSNASVYYFKKGQRDKAKQLLDKGLKIVPDNYELKTRKQMINGG